MTKEHIQKLFDYHDIVNQRVMDILFKGDLDYPDYAHTMFGHMLMTQHVWQRRIKQQAFDYEFWTILSQDQLKHLADLNKKELNEILEAHSLEEKIKYQALDGTAYSSLLSDIFEHVSHHYSYHRGQVAKSIREAGGTPPKTDLILFRR